MDINIQRRIVSCAGGPVEGSLASSASVSDPLPSSAYEQSATSWRRILPCLPKEKTRRKAGWKRKWILDRAWDSGRERVEAQEQQRWGRYVREKDVLMEKARSSTQD